MFLINIYLKYFEHQLEIPDFFKIINTGLLIFSTPIFILKNVNFYNNNNIFFFEDDNNIN